MSRELRRRRVLIVDDDESVLLSLEWLLETEGDETTVAWSGTEARALLAGGCFDVVLLDAGLRDISAPDLATLIPHGAQCVLLHPSTRLQQVDAVCRLGSMATICPPELAML